MKILPASILAIGMIFGTALITMHWEKIDKRESKFAEDCNSRDGTARRIDGILQCVRAERGNSIAGEGS